ncbi:MAG: gamma-carotene 1'-hydroxylase CruF [Cyanobacteriota bacterium]
MKRLVLLERTFLISHIVSMVFGLAGILLVLPHPQLIASLPDFGQTAFAWSMAGGGVVYMLLGTAAIAVYAYRTLGMWHWLSFMIPAVGISLSSELLGTSTGFPFGDYRYLTGLGYKIAGLVPFTIPLSWFYLGFAAYLLARAGLDNSSLAKWLKFPIAIALGSLLLTCWDFVLDPAMSQTTVPFWIWDSPGPFFGMPYQNFVGWLGTGAVFMTVAALCWKQRPVALPKKDLNLPLAVYLTNLAFSTVLSLAAGFVLPVLLGLLFGVIPALAIYTMASAGEDTQAFESSTTFDEEKNGTKVPAGVLSK